MHGSMTGSLLRAFSSFVRRRTHKSEAMVVVNECCCTSGGGGGDCGDPIERRLTTIVDAQQGRKRLSNRMALPNKLQDKTSCSLSMFF